MIEIPKPHTRETLLTCLDREIRMRETNYPSWVANGRLRATKAEDEIARMKAVRAVIAQLPATQPELNLQGRR
jgi:hypothetical protein